MSVLPFIVTHGANDPAMATLKRSSVLTAIPALTTAVFLIPVVLGLIGTWLPAFGYFPAIGLDQLSLTPWAEWFDHPSYKSAFLKTLFSGIGASVLSLVITFILLIGAYPSVMFQRLERLLSPILSVPHAAFAIGLGFLLSPSGWLIRWVEYVTGWFPVPPNWTTFQDPMGVSLIITLALKETPFLLFMSLAVLPSLNVQKTRWLANSMGRSTRFAWYWLLIPQLYQQIKLPFFAVVAFSLTVVDIALIAGPTTPPTLAVLITQLFNDPDLTNRTVGAAGATWLLILVATVLLIIHLLESPLRTLRQWAIQRRPEARRTLNWEAPAARALTLLMALAFVGSAAVTFIWSVTLRWRYPDVLPSQFSTLPWSRILNRIGEPFWCTVWLALLSALIALFLVILALENEVRLRWSQKRLNTQRIAWLIYLPLLIPQIAFLFGFQVFLIQTGWDGQFTALLWSHLVFVLPYVFLTLSGPYRKFDDRYFWLGLTLKHQRGPAYWHIKFPILMRPILYAFATGFAVSIAQYLPTIFIGAGKYSTITTEAVAMAAGSDRRLMAVMAVWQQSLPLLIFALATLLPALRFRERQNMR